MKERRFSPLNNIVQLEQMKEGKQIKDESGLVLDEVTAENTIPEGIVVAYDKDIKTLNKGDLVVFNSNNAYEFLLNGKKYLITNYDNLFGKII